MPIVLTCASTTVSSKKNTGTSQCQIPLDPNPSRSTHSRRTLSTGTLHRLKKDAPLQLQPQPQHKNQKLRDQDHDQQQQQQQQQQHASGNNGKHLSGPSSSPSVPSSSPIKTSSPSPALPSHLTPAPELLQGTTGSSAPTVHTSSPSPLFVGDQPHRITHQPSLPAHCNETKAGLLVSTHHGRPVQRHCNRTHRSSEEDRETGSNTDDIDDTDDSKGRNNKTHQYLIMKPRGRDSGTLSPSLSPPLLSPTSSTDNSASHTGRVLTDSCASPSTSASFVPLSPPASATTALPPPSILSSTIVMTLSSPISSPERIDSEETLSVPLDYRRPEDTSVDTGTNTANSSPSPPPLAPSCLWTCSTSERRGSESERDEPRTKRRRSMGSPRQSPSPAEHEPSKGAVSCRSPSSQASSALDAPLSGSLSTFSPAEQRAVAADGHDAAELNVSETSAHARSNHTPAAETKLSNAGVDKSGCPVSASANDTATAGVSAATATAAAAQPDYTQRPAISYAGMIIQALLETTKTKMTLGDIYSAIMQNHPYYRHAPTGWQNSVRNSLSLNKAFAKVERIPGEQPGHGCFWALQQDIRESGEHLLCRKRRTPETNSSTADPATPSFGAATAQPKGACLKLNCMTETHVEQTVPSVSSPPFLESAPSPAASEDAEDSKACPRRSGRARRPPRPKEAEEYVSLHVRQSSLTNAPFSTPPSSPAPHMQDREATPVVAPARKRASSVKAEKMTAPSSASNTNTSSDEKTKVPSAEARALLVTNAILTAVTPARKTAQDLDLASVPGVVTSQRIRRPPQNLSEFVSSEDFKAAPCGKRQERILQSSNSSGSLNSSSGELGKKESKRSKSEGLLSFCNSGKRASVADLDRQPMEIEPHQEGLDRSASMPDLAAASRMPRSKGSHQPATIPLSALSHAKRSSQDLSCLSSKKQRRNKRYSSREEILDRRRRDGKREIMVASEDDWSDSDFDFLRDEEENYRMMRIRARKIQRTRGRWSLRDEILEDGYVDLTGDEDGDDAEEAEHCRAEGEKIKLLMDPSVINYGFDSCDGEYILDYHQGPLFNNVTWPEFSDVKDESNSKGGAAATVDSLAASEQVIIDLRIDDDIEGRPLRSMSQALDSIDLTATSVSDAHVPTSPMMCGNGVKVRQQETDEWALFVDSCGPAMEDNTRENRHSGSIRSSIPEGLATMVADSLGLKGVTSLAIPLPDAEIAAVVAAVASGAVAEANHVHMEEIAVDTATSVGVKEEIEAEDFIGWSLCE